MQLIIHKNSKLTTCQRFFIEKSIELLYNGSIDSYRVRLNNPKTILEELKYCLVEFENGRIKHFQTIKSKRKEEKALIDDALYLLEYNPNYLNFNSISKKYLIQLFNSADETNFKKIISSIDILLKENVEYLSNVVQGVEDLVTQNEISLDKLESLDISLKILYSELISKGFSKHFLYKLVYGIFVNSLHETVNFQDHFSNFKQRILDSMADHTVVFRIDTTSKVYEAISTIAENELTFSDTIEESIKLKGRANKELETFKIRVNERKFISCKVKALDYYSALKKARNILSEYLDVLNLGLSDEFLSIHTRTLVIDNRSPENGNFQPNINILDGLYKVEKEHYISFSRKMPDILNNPNVASEAKEKIKSAIRYLRLGNQSTEIEHKFINYWIGLEYLFSNYESQSTINRLKRHFIDAHVLAYLYRNVHTFKKEFLQISDVNRSKITTFSSENESYLQNEQFYIEIEKQLLNDHPLLAYRAMKLKKWLFKSAKSSAKDYVIHHKENLEIHFTRIYRLRNEIIHDAATNTNNEQIASNLRYYLTFILHELIDFLSKNNTQLLSIEDYFILNEIKLGTIETDGYQLKDLLEMDFSIDFLF